MLHNVDTRSVGPMDDTVDPDRARPDLDPPELSPLDQRAEADPALRDALNRLTPAERASLDQLLTTYRETTDRYINSNPRWNDFLGLQNGMTQNVEETLGRILGGGMERGCDVMPDRIGHTLANHTNVPGSDWTVHPYSYVPQPDADEADHAMRLGGYVAAGSGAGFLAGGPYGAAAGAIGGAGGWFINSFEHNMLVLQSTRDPNIRIVLDPQGTQSGGADSVFGTGHYQGGEVKPPIQPTVRAAAP
ncbi:hypothetical protein DYH09_08060 [bacterium CPR1]|nr:hypothetical protein [bacterium CPR1]